LCITANFAPNVSVGQSHRIDMPDRMVRTSAVTPTVSENSGAARQGMRDCNALHTRALTVYVIFHQPPDGMAVALRS
jgi:hypothetical protein